MTAPEIQLREAVYVHLHAKLIAEVFPYNGFSIEETYAPTSASEGEGLKRGKLWIAIGLADKISLARNHAYSSRTPVHLFYQKNLTNFTDVDEVNLQVNLIHELNETLRLEFEYRDVVDGPPIYGWDRVEFVNDRDHPPLGINPALLRQGILEVNAIHYFNRGKA